MSRLSLILALFSFLALTNCQKDDNNRPTEDDREVILQYLDDNNITAEEHESGLFYQITREGTGPHPTLQDSVTVKYKGYLLDGTVFDQTPEGETRSFPLDILIPGWQVGIPLLKEGGAGTLFLPSSLGYGSRAVGIIPPYSVLIFEIDLEEVK